MHGFGYYQRPVFVIAIASVISTATAPAPHSLLLLLPVFNDWPAVQLLLKDLDAQLAALSWGVSVLLVDDGSTDDVPVDALSVERSKIARSHLLSLRRNLGHQRAIAVGLAYVAEHMPCEALVVMDADGEDSPADVPRLLARVGRQPSWHQRGCFLRDTFRSVHAA
jgi:glycosyltransferase involved in cell wall biosynthesis